MQASNMGTVTYQMTKWQDMENTVSHQLSVEYTHFSKEIHKYLTHTKQNCHK